MSRLFPRLITHLKKSVALFTSDITERTQSFFHGVIDLYPLIFVANYSFLKCHAAAHCPDKFLVLLYRMACFVR